MADAYIGQIDLFAFDYVPEGWMPCDGRELPIREYQALYALLGRQYGGDGATTFQLPDLRGRAVLGAGQAHGLQNYVQGQKGGAEAVSLQSETIPSHTHTLMANTGPGTTASGSNAFFAGPVPAQGQAVQPLYGAVGASTDAVPLNPQVVSTAGGGAGHNNMQPFCVLTYAIAVQGIFPPRN